MRKATKTAATVKRSKTVKRSEAAIRFLHKPSCTSCRKARGLLEQRGAKLDLRDLGKDRLTAEDLDKMIGDRDYRQFLNTRNELYRRHKMGQHPPTRPAALRLMAAEPNLIRRPVVICGSRIVLGFDEEALKEITP